MKTYGEVAGPSVPLHTIQRRDELLELLRNHPSFHTTVDIATMVGEPEGLTRKDLKTLERYGLVASHGHPRLWTAVTKATAVTPGVQQEWRLTVCEVCGRRVSPYCPVHPEALAVKVTVVPKDPEKFREEVGGEDPAVESSLS